jgi:hypothetical protein
MGASGNAASKSDLAALKSTVSNLQTKVKALETTSVDDKAIQGVVKNLDYLKLKNELSMSDLSSEVLKNPGAIAESVAQSFTTNSGRMVPIATALADNEKFAKTLADTLTDTSGKYRSALRGDKGETGELSTSKDAVKAALYDKKYTMWCADGDVCKVPAGVNTLEVPRIKIGNWYLEPHGGPDGNLHFHKGDVNDWFLSVENGKNLAVRNGHVNGKHIVNDVNNFYHFAEHTAVRRDRHYALNSRDGFLQNTPGCHNHDGCRGNGIPTFGGGKGAWEKFNFDQY